VQLIDVCSILQINYRSQQVVPRAAAEEEALSVNGLPSGEGSLVDFDELTDLIRYNNRCCIFICGHDRNVGVCLPYRRGVSLVVATSSIKRSLPWFEYFNELFLLKCAD